MNYVHCEPYVARLLGPADWQPLKYLRLRATHRHPEAFYVTHAQELLVTEQQWRERCTMRPGDACAVGVFEDGDLIGSMELFQQNRQPGELVLGRLYIEKAHADKAGSEDISRHQILLQAGLQWVATKTEFASVIAGIRTENLAAQKAFEKFGFTPHRSEYVRWPATGKLARQTFYTYDLEPMRAELRARPSPARPGPKSPLNAPEI